MRNPPRVILGIADSITSGAALLVDGRLVAAVNEERLCRIKMAMGWPRLAIEQVLKLGGVSPQDVEAVAVATKDLYWRAEAASINGYFDTNWGPRKNLALKAGSVGSRLLGDYPWARTGYYRLKRLMTRSRHRHIRHELEQVHRIKAPVEFIDHHDAHAASAYYTGGQSLATIVTLDGAGDSIAAGVYHGQRGRLARVHRVDSYDSIGNYYSYITHLLGFKAHQHEGKITGLAAYGEPLFVDRLRQLICYAEGSIHNRARAFHTAAVEKLRKALPADARREDIAASIQALLEEVCVAYVRHWAAQVRRPHLGVAGGVVANVKLNQRLLEIPEIDSIFVHPGMGDDGLAVGAAYELAADQQSAPEDREALVRPLEHVYLGPSYSDSEIHRALERSGLRYTRCDDIADEVAEAIAQRKVVARFDGAMEYGPRALGNRSILVHAGDVTINDWLNKRLKRTEFMPFAPVTLEEEWTDNYLQLYGAEHAAHFMTITTDCTGDLKERCPAVVHVDGTARPQLVGSENRAYRSVLERYRDRTGYSTMINTSFNMHEEPIVCTPDDAIRAFTLGHLDYLAIGSYLVPADDQASLPTKAEAIAERA